MGFPLFWRSFIPKIKDEQGRVPLDSISSLGVVSIGSVPQCVLIRGYSSRNPVILFLHGGPGMPSMYLAHRLQGPLEKDFFMVQWERRGAGKTYSKDAPPESMSVTQEVADTVELVNLMRARFRQSKVCLVGHSYGSYLGMIVAKRFPELFHAYVGIGQLAYSEERIREVQDDGFGIKRRRGNGELLKELDAKVPIDREKWLFRFGGVLRHKTSFASLLLTGLQAPEYSLMDTLKVRKGVNFTHRNMKYDAINEDLIHAIQRVEVPIYFFTGRYDLTGPFELSEGYEHRLQAPKKEIVWVEESAHFPFLEESVKFAQEMGRVAMESQG